jgi:hypothetical protein
MIPRDAQVKPFLCQGLTFLLIFAGGTLSRGAQRSGLKRRTQDASCSALLTPTHYLPGFDDGRREWMRH